VATPTWATFITTFNRPDVLAETIRRVLDQTVPPDVLLIVDNGTDPGTEEVARAVGDPRIVYERTGDNLGSAGGVSYGMQWVADHGYDWAHSVDDDNPPSTPDMIERLQALVARHEGPALGAVGSNGGRWNWAKGEFARIRDDELVGDLRVDTIGGNANLTVRREVIQDIGPPERAFFFGFYDPLYCLRIAQAGYELWVDGELHRETRVLAKRIDLEPGRRALVPRDPYSGIWRRYYVTRNYIFRMTRTFQRPDLARRQALRALGQSVGSWRRGPRYGLRYTTLQVRGIFDGYRGRLGRRIEPMAKTSKAG
jgi:glycosyltransferase involved in cell wall biosynthesis